MSNHSKLGRAALAAALAIVVLAGGAFAQDDASLEERVRRLEEELAEQDRSEQSEDTGLLHGVMDNYEAGEGLQMGRTSLGAYGEFIYNNVLGGRTAKDTFEPRRVVLFVGHEFSEEWRFFSEIEIEHADEIFLEQAFLDWQPSEELGFQAGVILLPLGIINVTHEPTTFYFSERPQVDHDLIPSTFREAGVMAYGSFGDLSYNLGVFNAGEIEGVSNAAAPNDSPGDLSGIATGGIRFMRQKAIKAFANDFAISGRLQYRATQGLTLGVGGYTGEIDQNHSNPVSIIDSDARISIAEVDARFVMDQFEVRGQYAIVWIGGAGAMNTAMTLPSNPLVNAVPDRQHGGYVELAYDVLPFITDSDQRLYVAFRGEWLDLQASLPKGGFAKAGGAEEQQNYNFGVAWKPLRNVIVKADYQIRDDDTVAGLPDQFNASVGFDF